MVTMKRSSSQSNEEKWLKEPDFLMAAPFGKRLYRECCCSCLETQSNGRGAETGPDRRM